MRKMAGNESLGLVLCCLMGLPACGEGSGDADNGNETPDDGNEDPDGSGDGSTDDADSDDSGEGGTDTDTDPPQRTAFRFSEMYIRDPHFFLLALGVLCIDATDEVPTGESINEQFNNGIQADDPDEPDGYLDLSFLTVFRDEPDPTSSGGTMDIAMGQCTVPIETTECTIKPATALVPADFVNYTTGDCFAPRAEDLSDQNYTPQPQTATAPCLHGSTPALDLDFSDFVLELQDVEFGARYPDGSSAGLSQGLLRGFLTEAIADATILPESLDPMVANKPISELLPGGTNCCAEHDDSDMNDGVPGWWIYVDFSAEMVPWTHPE